jgi:hypothetical protein
MSKQGMGMVKGRGMLQGRGMLGWSWALVAVIARVVVASSRVPVVASLLSSRVVLACPGRVRLVVVLVCRLRVLSSRFLVDSSLSWCVLAVSWPRRRVSWSCGRCAVSLLHRRCVCRVVVVVPVVCPPGRIVVLCLSKVGWEQGEVLTVYPNDDDE